MDILIISIILILSIVQSVVGVGLLLFGTPTLLILGFSYTETIAMLVPASICISLLQIHGNFNLIRTKKAVVIFTLPMVLISLTALIFFEFTIDIKKIVGSMLILFGLIRVFSLLKSFLQKVVISNRYFFCLIMGFVHGISNMGGGLLVLFMDSMFKTKDEIRINVAFGYLLFGIVQISVLAIFSFESFSIMSIVLPLIAIITYYFIGRRLGDKVNDHIYQHFVTFFVFIYGFLSFIKI